MPDDKSATQVEQLLCELCIDHGFCMPLRERDTFAALAPSGIDTFTDAVLATEGLHPSVAKALRRRVRSLVAKYYAAWENRDPS